MTVKEPAWRKKSRPCPFYNRKGCLFGDSCNFLHEVNAKASLDAHATRSSQPNARTASESDVFESDSSSSSSSVESHKRSPRMSNLLVALRDVIGSDDEDQEEQGWEKSVHVHHDTINYDDDDVKSLDIVDDDERDDENIDSDIDSLFGIAVSLFDDGDAAHEQEIGRPRTEAPTLVNSQVVHATGTLSLDMLSPIHIFPASQLRAFKNEFHEPSIASNSSDSWNGPIPFVLSPPHNSTPSSTIDLISSPLLSSPSFRLSPRSSPLVRRIFPTESPHESVDSIDNTRLPVDVLTPSGLEVEQQPALDVALTSTTSPISITTLSVATDDDDNSGGDVTLTIVPVREQSTMASQALINSALTSTMLPVSVSTSSAVVEDDDSPGEVANPSNTPLLEKPTETLTALINNASTASRMSVAILSAVTGGDNVSERDTTLTTVALLQGPATVPPGSIGSPPSTISPASIIPPFTTVEDNSAGGGATLKSISLLEESTTTPSASTSSASTVSLISIIALSAVAEGNDESGRDATLHTVPLFQEPTTASLALTDGAPTSIISPVSVNTTFAVAKDDINSEKVAALTGIPFFEDPTMKPSASVSSTPAAFPTPLTALPMITEGDDDLEKGSNLATVPLLEEPTITSPTSISSAPAISPMPITALYVVAEGDDGSEKDAIVTALPVLEEPAMASLGSIGSPPSPIMPPASIITLSEAVKDDSTGGDATQTTILSLEGPNMTLPAVIDSTPVSGHYLAYLCEDENDGNGALNFKDHSKDKIVTHVSETDVSATIQPIVLSSLPSSSPTLFNDPPLKESSSIEPQVSISPGSREFIVPVSPLHTESSNLEPPQSPACVLEAAPVSSRASILVSIAESHESDRRSPVLSIQSAMVYPPLPPSRAGSTDSAQSTETSTRVPFGFRNSTVTDRPPSRASSASSRLSVHSSLWDRPVSSSSTTSDQAANQDRKSRLRPLRLSTVLDPSTPSPPHTNTESTKFTPNHVMHHDQNGTCPDIPISSQGHVIQAPISVPKRRTNLAPRVAITPPSNKRESIHDFALEDDAANSGDTSAHSRAETSPQPLSRITHTESPQSFILKGTPEIAPSIIHSSPGHWSAAEAAAAQRPSDPKTIAQGAEEIFASAREETAHHIEAILASPEDPSVQPQFGTSPQPSSAVSRPKPTSLSLVDPRPISPHVTKTLSSRPTLMFAIAADDVQELERVLASGEAHPNDVVGPQSALEFTLTNERLSNKMDIVKTLLAYGADASSLRKPAACEVDSYAIASDKEETAPDMQKIDPATRYYVEQAQSEQVQRTFALISRSTFKPLSRMRYNMIGQDRVLEQLFRVLRIHSQKLSLAPLVVLLCGPCGLGKTYLARKFGLFLDIPTHTVHMTTLQTPRDLWRSCSFSYHEEPSNTTLSEFLLENEGKRCVVVLDEIEKSEHERVLWSLCMPWETGWLEMDGRPVDTRQVVWIGTSNLGSELVFQHSEARADEDLTMSREEYVGLMNAIRPFVADKLGASLMTRVTATLPFVPFTRREKLAIAAEAFYTLGGEDARDMSKEVAGSIMDRCLQNYLSSEGARSLYRAMSNLLMDAI